MKNIYADLFLADEWLSINNSFEPQADSTLFYEPIFNKYGYTSYDFRRSVNHYLKDPVRYSRILVKTIDLLDSKRDIILSLMKKETRRDEELEILASHAPKLELFPLVAEVPIEVDSVEFLRDTSMWYLPGKEQLLVVEKETKTKPNKKNERFTGEILPFFE